MIVVDSHTHVAPSWYEPVEVLMDQMDRHGVDRAVLVQTSGQWNNDYILQSAARFPDRISAVVMLDVGAADALATLEQLVDGGAVGVRLRPETRSPGEDPLAIWRAAGRLGITATCFGKREDFASDGFEQVIASVPETRIVIEHLGGGNRPDSDPGGLSLRRKIFTLGKYQNAYTKFHGLGEFSPRAMPPRDTFPFEEPVLPLLDEAFAAFGPNRMLWGSDYPIVSSREGYGNALRFPMKHFESKTAEERALMFGGVAASLFPCQASR